MKAAIDLGTNSCRLLIMNQDNETVYRDIQTTRIGAGQTHSSKKISPAALQRTLDCLQEYRYQLARHQVSRYRAVATAAVREASNREEMIRYLAAAADLELEIISSREEAYLSYIGATTALQLSSAPLLVDVGGGSSEFICPEIGLISSVPVGAVRVKELGLDPGMIRASFLPLLNAIRLQQSRPLVFVGGTATSLAAIKLQLQDYDAQRINGQLIRRHELERIYHDIHRMPLHRRRHIPGLQPERADIIDSGLLILLMITSCLGCEEFYVSDHDLLHGIIYSL